MAQCEASEGEALRHRQRVEHQERELKDLQEVLNTERAKIQVGMKGRIVDKKILKEYTNVLEHLARWSA